MHAIKADGLYISAYNKNLNIRKIKRNNYKIIGAAHNIKSKFKKTTRMFKNFFLVYLKLTIKIKKDFRDYKFNLIARLINTSLIPLRRSI